MTFSALLTQWRDQNRWTQAAAAEFLADKLGCAVPIRTFDSWEKGKHRPHGITKAAIESVIKDENK